MKNGLAAPGADHRGALWWSFDQPHLSISSGSVGGGLRPMSWIVNIGVEPQYRRTDLTAHATDVAASLRLHGDGTALLTAANVAASCHTQCDGVQAWVTLGVRRPTWAADPSALAHAGHRLPDTINTVIIVPASLGEAALVQAALAATEAKTQACIEFGLDATGTASDATVIAADPTGAPHEFCGVRSHWGARVALAAHEAVQIALRRAT